MKASVVILIILGVVAAISVTLLTTSLGIRSRIGSMKEPQAKILVAAQKIEPRTMIGQNLVQTRTVALRQAPAGAYSDPAQVAGRMLITPLAEGQALTPECFAPKGVGLELASRLPPGMRAVTISLTNPGSLKGILYPGSVVDVIASFRIQGGNNAIGEAVATTMLEDVEILAVDDQAVAKSDSTDENASKKPASGGNDQSLVTLKVDSRQAEGLQLASEYGEVRLALRNPFDKKQVDQDATLLNQGKLAGMADLLKAVIQQREGTEPAKEAEPKAEEPAPEVVQVANVAPPQPAEPAGWTIETYRGITKETTTIPAK